MPRGLDVNGQGVDVNAQTWSGWTALHYAAACGHAECVTALLQRGADPDIRVVLTGCTPYMLACQIGAVECVEALVVLGKCEEGIVDDHYRTGALHPPLATSFSAKWQPAQQNTPL